MDGIADTKTNVDEAFAKDEWSALVRREALIRLKAQVSAKQFQIFEAYVLRDMPVIDVARTLGVTEEQVYQAKSRVGKVFTRQWEEVEQELDAPRIPDA